jgi:hypothetical protein
MAGVGSGASGSGPWAKDLGQVTRMERSIKAAALTRLEDLPRGISAGPHSASSAKVAIQRPTVSIWESWQAAQNSELRFSSTLEGRAIVHCFAGYVLSVFYFGKDGSLLEHNSTLHHESDIIDR